MFTEISHLLEFSAVVTFTKRGDFYTQYFEHFHLVDIPFGNRSFEDYLQEKQLPSKLY